MSSAMTIFEYPSQQRGGTHAPEPMLLDTCTVQHLETVMGMFEDERGLNDESAGLLMSRFGRKLGPELVALGDLMTLFQSNGPPWAVSETSLIELGRVSGPRGLVLARWWWDWRHYWDGWSDAYPEIDHDGLMWPRTVVSRDQLALFQMPPTMPAHAAAGHPLEPIRDAGDRAIVRDGVRAGIPAILTTDLRSFWSGRQALFGYGVEVWRPTDVWRSYGGEVIATAA